MPQRTNDFQKLVSLVQKALVPSGAKVSDSALVDVPGMSEPREIDVLIETAVGPYHMKIAVEAKDNKRKLDTTQFESLVGKYFVEGGVKVDKVVIVTHNGFFKPVIERAKKLGVELLTLSEATDWDWNEYQPNIKPFETNLRICDIEVFPKISDSKLEQVLKEGLISCSHGTEYGNAYQFASFIFINSILKNHEDQLREADKAAAEEPEGKKAKVELLLDHPHVIRLHEKEYPFEKIVFGIHFSKSNEPSNSIKSEIHFQFAPHICRIEVTPAFERGIPKELVAESQLVCKCCDKDRGILGEWVSKAVFDGVFRQQPDVVKQFYDAVRRSPNGEARLKVEWKIEGKWVLRFRGNDYSLDTISAEVHAISAKAPLDCKQYELAKPDGDGQLLSHLEATAGGKKFSIVIPHFEDGHPDKIVLKVDNAQNVVTDSNSIRNI